MEAPQLCLTDESLPCWSREGPKATADSLKKAHEEGFCVEAQKTNSFSYDSTGPVEVEVNHGTSSLAATPASVEQACC